MNFRVDRGQCMSVRHQWILGRSWTVEERGCVLEVIAYGTRSGGFDEWFVVFNAVSCGRNGLPFLKVSVCSPIDAIIFRTFVHERYLSLQFNRENFRLFLVVPERRKMSFSQWTMGLWNAEMMFRPLLFDRQSHPGVHQHSVDRIQLDSGRQKWTVDFYFLNPEIHVESVLTGYVLRIVITLQFVYLFIYRYHNEIVKEYATEISIYIHRMKWNNTNKRSLIKCRNIKNSSP